MNCTHYQDTLLSFLRKYVEVRAYTGPTNKGALTFSIQLEAEWEKSRFLFQLKRPICLVVRRKSQADQEILLCYGKGVSAVRELGKKCERQHRRRNKVMLSPVFLFLFASEPSYCKYRRTSRFTSFVRFRKPILLRCSLYYSSKCLSCDGAAAELLRKCQVYCRRRHREMMSHVLPPIS